MPDDLSFLDKYVKNHDVSDLLERMRGGTFEQESGGNYQVRRNARTGAVGGFQVMPANIPSWTKTYVGRSYTPDEFERDPKAQDAVFSGEMGKYLRKARQLAPDDDTAIRMAAAAWYGGEGAMKRYDDPKRFRANEPSFREYTSSVLKRSSKPSKNLSFLDKYLSTETPTFLDKYLPQPVPESQNTFELQRQAAADPKVKSRTGVLLNQGDAPPAWDGFGAHQMPDGRTMMVHSESAAKNLKLKTPEDVQTFLDKNPVAIPRMTGIVDDVGTATGDDQPVVTAQVGDHEAASAVVTNPEKAVEQAAVYKEQFPQANVGMATTDDITRQRVAKLGGIGEAAKAGQRFGQQVPSGGGQAGVPRRNGISRAEASVPVQDKWSVDTSGASTDFSDPNIQAALNQYPQLDEQENISDTQEVKGGLRAIPRKQVGKETDDLNRVVSTFYPTSAKDDRDATIQALVDAGERWGLSKAEAAAYVDKLGKPLQKGGWKKDTGIQVTYEDIANATGRRADIQAELRAEQVQNRVDRPDLSANPKLIERDAEILKEYGKPLAALVTGGAATILPEETQKDIGALLSSGFLASGGRTSEALAGVLKAAREGSPILASANLLGFETAGFGDSVIDFFKDAGQSTAALSEATDKQSSLGKWPTKIVKLAGGLPGDLSRLAILSKLPGGAITGFSLDSALPEVARDSDTSTVIKAGAKGAAIGALFALAPGAGRMLSGGNPVLKEGIELGTISGGTYALATQFGSTSDQAFEEAVLNSMFHLSGKLHQGLTGKTVRARDNKGNEVNVTIDKNGKVTTVAADKPADIELFIPKNFKAYAEKDAKIQSESVSQKQTKSDLTSETILTPEQVSETIPDVYKDVGTNEKGETTYKGETEKQMQERRDFPNRLQNIKPENSRLLAKDKGIKVADDAFEGLPEAERRKIAVSMYDGTFEPKGKDVAPEPVEKGFEVVEPVEKPVENRATSEPVVPPVEAKGEPPTPSEPPVGEGKKPAGRERKYPKTLAKTERGEFEPSTYFPDTMRGWKGEAEKIVNEKGVDAARDEYFSNKDLAPKIKNALGLGLIDAHGQRGDIETMNRIAADMIESSTAQGQAVKALDLANRYDPHSWRFIASKYKAKSGKGELTSADVAKGQQKVTQYTKRTEDLDLVDRIIEDNRAEAETRDAEIIAIDKAINEQKSGELESLKKEVADLRKQLDAAKKDRPKVNKRVKDLLADIKARKQESRTTIKAFVKETERGSFILSPKEKYKLSHEDTGLDEPVFNAFRDISVEKLAEELPKGEMSLREFHKFLEKESEGKLNEAQRNQVMAAAVNELRQTREHSLTPEQLKKQRIRREFYKTAYQILGEARTAEKRASVETVKGAVKEGIASPVDIWNKQLVDTAANLGVDDAVLVGANVLKTTHNLSKWREMMHDIFPEIKRNDFGEIYKKSYELRENVNNDLRRNRAEKTAKRKLTDDEYRALQAKQKTARSQMMRARGELEGYYHHLAVSTARKVGRGIRAVTNAPRTFQTGWDVSYSGRQAMALNAMQSGVSASALRKGLKEGITEENFDNILYQMERDPIAQEMKDMGWLSRAILHNPLDFEEFYLSNLPMKLADIGKGTPETRVGKFLNKAVNTKGGKIATAIPKLAGEGFKASERIFELQGDLQAYEVYKRWTEENPNMDDRAKRHLIRTINAGTGRGNIKAAFGTGGYAQDLLSEVFYSFRFLTSRAEFVAYTNPLGIAFAPKGARAVLARKSVGMWAKTASIFIPLAMLGMTSLDPEDDEFMKVRYGDQSWDITGKLNEPLRQLAMGVKAAYYYGMTQSDDEDLRKTGEGGLARIGNYYSDAGAWAHWFRGKMSPQATLAIDRAMKEDYLGRPFTWTNAAATRAFPLGVQNLWGAIVYDQKEAMMRNPVTFDTFANNVKNLDEKAKQNWVRAMFSFIPDVAGIGSANYPKEESTTADREAARLKKFTPKADDEPELIEGTPKWRITNSLVRLKRMGYDIQPELDKYKASGDLDDKDIAAINKKSERLWIEQKLDKATTDEVIQVLRYTTPYEWFMRPFMTKNDRNREIERERLLKLLQIKGDRAFTGKDLTPEEEQNIRKVIPNYVPKKVERNKATPRTRPVPSFTPPKRPKLGMR